MKRFLWLTCLCSASAFAVACGDDATGGDASEDGGTELTLDQVNDRIDGVDDAVTGIQGDVDDLGTSIDDLGTSVDDLTGNVDDLDTRIADLENPEILSCREEEICIPDGVSFVQMGVEDIVALLCELEINCCTADELAYKFGPGITTVAECTETFVDLINNGFSPDFLTENGFLINYVIQMAQALNDTRVREGLDDAAIALCLDFLEARECPQFEESVLEEPLEHCETQVLEEEENPCDPELLIVGLQEEGELCGLSYLPECADDLVCRRNIGLDGSGLCATPAAAGDRCTHDGQCDQDVTDMFCNLSTGECQARGGPGDDCLYVDPTFTITNPGDLYPGFDEGSWLQNPGAVAVECTRGTSCDPISGECVANCSAGSLCNAGRGNMDCPDGHTCNVTEIPALRNNFGFGICLPPLADDAPCADTDGSECASHRCMFETDGYICFPPLKAEGAACTVTIAGAGQYDSECVTGFCAADSTTTTAGKCATRCGDQAECPATHFCDWDIYIDESHGDDYYPCDLKRANNAVTCGTNTDGSDPAGTWNNYECASGFCYGSPTFLCQAKAAAGGACASGQDSACPNTEYCNVAVCEAFEATDTLCVASTDCGPGNYCWNNGTTMQCKAYGEAGDDCAAGRQCAWDGDAMYCATIGAAFQCQPVGAFPTGAFCNVFTYDNDNIQYNLDTNCASNWCRASDNTCQDAIAEGEACNSANLALNRCATGTFCKYPLDEDTTVGECTAQATAGQSCNPRYTNAFVCGSVYCPGNCLNNQNCELQSDAFVCSYQAVPEETLFCDGT